MCSRALTLHEFLSHGGHMPQQHGVVMWNLAQEREDQATAVPLQYPCQQGRGTQEPGEGPDDQCQTQKRVQVLIGWCHKIDLWPQDWNCIVETKSSMCEQTWTLWAHHANREGTQMGKCLCGMGWKNTFRCNADTYTEPEPITARVTTTNSVLNILYAKSAICKLESNLYGETLFFIVSKIISKRKLLMIGWVFIL